MKYTEHYSVMSHDTDVNNNASPSIILRYLQETANHQMRDRKPTFFDLLESGRTFIVTRMAIEVKRQLNQYDKIEVGTWNCPGKLAVFRRGYDIYANGELAVRAYGEWAAAEIESRKILTAAEVDISTYEVGELPELDIPKKFRFPKDMEFEKVAVRHITYSDIDMNIHVNNTIYPDMFWENIPGIVDKKVTSFNMRFLKEAKLGDDIEIFMAKAPLDLVKDPAAEEAYAFESFVGGEKNFEIVFGLAKAEKLDFWKY